MNERTLRIGVIGVGGMGARHARNLAGSVTHGRVTAVMDVDTARASAVAKECGGARVYDDAPALIRDPHVDAVVIASPDPTHASLAQACLAAEKPVLCEKPLATNLQDARAVVEAEAALGRRLIQVGFMRVYDPTHQDVKAVVTSGRIGRPLFFRGLHTNVSLDGLPRTLEDVVVNSAVHDIHSARWLLDDEATQVFTQHIPWDPNDPTTCRLVTMQIRFARGGLAFIEMNADAGYGYEVTAAVVGERGAVESQALGSPAVRIEGVRSQTVDPDWLVRFDTAYTREIQAWAEDARSGRHTGPSTWDGYMALAIAEAALESARAGRPVAVKAMERPEIYGG
jgi:myo-inositol 2-dehydrogenase/D-chiro-inositol 1-dehydrogenase